MTCNKVHFGMSYGVLSVHHLEHRTERRLFFPKYYDLPVWNDPLPEERLGEIEHKVREALSMLDERYKYAINGKVKIHPRRTSVEINLGIEDDLKEEILHKYFDLAGVPNYFHNISIDFLNRALQPYGKRLQGFEVVDRDLSQN